MLNNQLLLKNKQIILRGIEESISSTSKLIESSHHIQNITNQNEFIVGDILSLGKKISLTDTYRALLQQKLTLEKEIAQLSTEKFNLSNRLSLLSALNNGPIKLTNSKDYTDFIKEYIALAEEISQRIQEFSNYFTNPEMQSLYSQQYQPILQPQPFDKKLLIIVLGISFLLSFLTTIIFLIIRSNASQK